MSKGRIGVARVEEDKLLLGGKMQPNPGLKDNGT